MGIDACILIRNKAPFTPERLLHESYLLASTLGHEKFFINEQQHALKAMKTWEQDGPTIRPQPGEQLIKVNLWSRYYGPGYERGDWPAIRGVICWFWANHPSCETWYGGDSSGVRAARVGPEELTVLDQHYYTHGHRPYVGGFQGLSHERAPVCPRCGEPANHHGGGGGQELWGCSGCGLQLVTGRDQVFLFDHHWDIFAALKAVQGGTAKPAPHINRVPRR